MARLGKAIPVEIIPASGLDRGSFVFLWGPRAGFSALGARGKPAEQVADEVAAAYKAFCQSHAALDPHLADQILPYLALAKGASAVTTAAITSHLLTNAWVIKQFFGPIIEIHGQLGQSGEIVCQGQQ
jgi:RNA 3'-terminal phosphate cyclase (ATP)